MSRRSSAGFSFLPNRMLYHLTFTDVLSYPHAIQGITLRVVLSSGPLTIEAMAKLDLGAHVCLFSREIGEQLDFDIESGAPIKLGAIVFGTLDAFGHEVTFRVGGIVIPLMVYFAKDYGLPMNFIG
ncbi:MAG: hypothetical protein L0220_16620, partial [Acidobacteria bacterium]|nr:hypothetical protein [Acidobacteriota bacterium]